jgi:hypothetical protein
MTKGAVIAAVIAVVLFIVIAHTPWVAVGAIPAWAGGFLHGRLHAQARYFWHGVKRAHDQATD